MSAIKTFFSVVLYQPLYNILIFLVWLMPGHSLGWAIVILTILIRLALLPSSLKQVRTQQKMKELQGEMQKTRGEHRGDKQAEAQALMALYKKHGVSPLSGCLPMLIQLPILIVLYRVLMNGFNTDSFQLLYNFMPRPEYIQAWFLGINLAVSDKFYILPVLAGLAQFVQSRQMQGMQPLPIPSGDKKGQPDFSTMLTKQMLYVFPLMTVIIGVRLPAALVLYWLVMTLFMVGQQWWASKNSNLKPQISKLEEGEIRPMPMTGITRPKEIEETKKTRSGVTVEIRKKA